MDKKWIDLSNRVSDEYVHGVVKFLDFAFLGKQDGSRICCPCRKCRNRFSKTREDVMLYCLRDGFDPTYKNWTCHGEAYIPLHRNEGVEFTQSDSRDDMESMLRDALRIPDKDVNMDNSQQSDFENLNGADKETKRFLKLLRDAETELFPGCRKQTKLSFIARLLHLKVLCHWSNNSVDLLLELLKDSFPDDVNLPANYYEANKITTELGFICQIIDACPNNCMLFRGKDGKLEKCEICGELRYKDDALKVATKRMRYFPLKPRLQKLFMSSKTSSLMRWHAEERIDDGVLRHPADSRAWKNFDERNPTFANDIRNVRLGLATDGFNPFGTMNVSHSIWPVVLMTYNLPPWLCMKQPSFILSIIIDGPKGPGNKIDVYMQPLIDELKELWNTGVQTYDASSDQLFQLHAALLWTISDFPGYGNISGWGTRGVLACPNCGLETRSKYLKNGHKFCYCGHRRFLSTGHKLRRDKVSFDGTMELSQKPSPLSEMELLQQLEHVPTEYKKKDLKKRWMEKNDKHSAKKRKIDQNAESPWKKKSIFFELPYWAGNLVRHNLDVMHIEKNVCDNILFTLLGAKGKTKDNLNARKDLQLLKIRSPLHPIQRPNGGFYLPASSFTMSSNEKKIFCSVLKSLRPPDGYASNISRHVQLDKHNIWGLKSHDNHILMQKLLPIAARRALPKNVVDALIELSNFFRKICSKMNSTSDLEKIQDRIALTLCHFEKIFPPSFFDIMEHLPIHLAEEALVAGPVQFRWMYPIERYLSTLKKYVRNRAHPEGSIARGYLMDECMNFCSRYLKDIETKENRLPRNYDGDNQMGRGLHNGKRCIIDKDTLLQIHRYVFANIYNYFKQELSKKPESERTREFKETLFKNAMGENNSRVRSLERRRKRAALAAFGSTTFQHQEDKEEMQKLKNEMKEEREKLEYMKDEFNREKNELLIEKEKVNNLTKNLEMFISQFPAISSAMSHSAQVPDASSSHGKAINGFNSSPNHPTPEEQIVGGKSKKQKTVQDYYVNSIKIGTRAHLFCHGIPKNIVGQGLVVSMDDDERKDDHAFVKVYVEKALIPDEKLRRPHEGARVIGEVVHKCIYWEFIDVMEI